MQQPCFFARNQAAAADPSARHGVGKARALFQLVLQLGQVGMRAAPVQLRETEAQPAQGAAHGNVGQRQVHAAAMGLLAQAVAHFGHAGLHLGTVGKSELLKRVVLEGPLPRKTFSMGEAHEKRFYIEARRIR